MPSLKEPAHGRGGGGAAAPASPALFGQLGARSAQALREPVAVHARAR